MFPLCKTIIIRIWISEVCKKKTRFWNTYPDDGCFTQPKHTAFLITLIQCCVLTECFIVAQKISEMLEFAKFKIPLSPSSSSSQHSLGYLLTRSSLTHPAVSLMVAPGSFYHSVCGFLLSSVIRYGELSLYAATRFFCLSFFNSQKIAEGTKHTLIQARLARWLIDLAWCC